MVSELMTEEVSVDTTEPRGMLIRVSDVWQHRSLLFHLTKRELRVRYKGSVLGVFWSLLSPAMYLLVFSIVFTELLRVQIPLFGIFLLSGLVAWNAFSGTLSAASNSLIENRALVQKVWFPREVLPLASVGASLVNMIFQLGVLMLGLLIFQRAPGLEAFPLLVLAVVALVLLSAGFGLALAALNVGFRDVKHLVEVALTAWFWMSAVVYPYASVADRLGDKEWLTTLNPMVPVVLTFQRFFYNPPAVSEDGTVVLPELDIGWFLPRLGFSIAAGVAITLIGFWIFARSERDFGDRL